MTVTPNTDATVQGSKSIASGIESEFVEPPQPRITACMQNVLKLVNRGLQSRGADAEGPYKKLISVWAMDDTDDTDDTDLPLGTQPEDHPNCIVAQGLEGKCPEDIKNVARAVLGQLQQEHATVQVNTVGITAVSRTDSTDKQEAVFNYGLLVKIFEGTTEGTSSNQQSNGVSDRLCSPKARYTMIAVAGVAFAALLAGVYMYRR